MLYVLFPLISKLLMSSSISVMLENILYMIYILQHLLGPASWSDKSSVFEKMPHVSKKNVCSGAEWRVLQLSGRSPWFIVLLNSFIFLLIGPVVLSIIENGVSKFPTIIVKLSISCFSFVSFCFVHFWALSLGA